MTRRPLLTCDHERGETLAELLVTIAILGIAIAAIVGGLADGILASDIHRQHATADTAARSVAECWKDRSLAWQSNGDYSTSLCGAPANFAGSIAPSPLRATCWNNDYPATFSSSASQTGDYGLQELVITATSSNGRGVETITAWKRRT